MTDVRIAFVVPAYNAAATIARAVRSAVEQSEPAMEIVVVDDGSSDDTALIARQHGARVLRRSNGGPGAARNTGIQATEAEWIALLDADDVARPDRIECQCRHVDDSSVAVIHGMRSVPALHAAKPMDHLDFATLWQKNRISTSTVLLRRSAWAAVGGFDETPALIGVEDYNLWLRLAHSGAGFLWLSEILADYLPGRHGLSSQLERFAKAELSNVQRLGEQLQLPRETVLQKEYRLYRDYGVELFHRGVRRSAREFLREASRRGRLDWSARLRLWAASVGAGPMKNPVHSGS
ncbi:MAG: glycosyltransferase family 2 protein [Gemmatimonadales bacterium]